MKYKLTENGNIVVKDGHPVVIDGDKEITIDAIGANAKITALVAESNDRRKKLSDVTAELATASGLNTDLQSQVDSIDGKSKVKIDELKDTINKTWEAKQADWETKEKSLTADLFDAKVGVKFATSKTIAGLVLPPDIAKATFSSHFNSDGSANDANGNPIYSKEKPGEIAGFEEAMTHIIDNYPNKDAIMKSSGAEGSGSHNSGGGGDDGGPTDGKSMIAAGLKSMAN